MTNANMIDVTELELQQTEGGWVNLAWAIGGYIVGSILDSAFGSPGCSGAKDCFAAGAAAAG